MKQTLRVITPALALIACRSYAIPSPIPQESGFSGFIGVTASYVNYSSNLVAGNGIDNLADSQVDSLTDSPDSKDASFLGPYLDLRYTFANSRTQFVLGNLIEDAVRFDFTQVLGIRQEIGEFGILSAAFVFSGFPSEVWVDPYEVGKPRTKTDRKTNGLRLQWEQIRSSPFDLSYTYRDISLDQDDSGRFAVDKGWITAEQQQLLRREGKDHRFEISYDYKLNKRDFFTPSLIYRKRNLKGDAESNDRFAVELTYTRISPTWTYIVNGYAGREIHQKDNPIFGEKTDSTDLGVTFTVFRHQLFGQTDLSGFASVIYAESHSNVDFHDMDIGSANIGLIYRF